MWEDVIHTLDGPLCLTDAQWAKMEPQCLGKPTGPAKRETSLETCLSWLDLKWAAGQHNGAASWRSLRAQGFRGSLRVVTEWVTRRRRAEKPMPTRFTACYRPEPSRG